MNVLLTKAVGFGEGLVGVDNMLLVFEQGDLIHEDLDGLGVAARNDGDFVESVGKRRICGRNLKEFLVVHDENSTNTAGL